MLKGVAKASFASHCLPSEILGDLNLVKWGVHCWDHDLIYFFINAIYQNDQVHFSLKTDVILSFHELVLNFNQYLTCIYWNDYIFSLYFVNVVNSIGWFLSGRSTLHCWHKSHLPRTFHCIIRFISCWIWFLNVSLPTIMYMLMKNVSLYVNKKC